MTARMNWRKASLAGRPTLDFRREHDASDRDLAGRWLRQAESRLGQERHERRKLSRASHQSSRVGSTDWATAASSAVSFRGAMSTLEFHPLANIFPLIEGYELARLVDDIRTHGLREPVVLYQGRVLDGRNRLRACEAAGRSAPCLICALG
jgi:ParB-like nuclease domain